MFFRNLIITVFKRGVIFTGIFSMGCNVFSNSEEEVIALTLKEKSDYIRAIPGEDEEVPDELLQRGKVLISYSDCYICHKENERVRGPAFTDIAQRYPRNEVFITILAQRVIYGGSGAWGHAEMSPHPSLSDLDAQAMVSYILSINKR